MRVVLLTITLLSIACSQAPEPSSVSTASEAIATFRTQLQSELKEAMARGPEHAITVCRERASQIAAEAGSARLQLGRSSQRLRNPANAAAGWLEPLLEHYAQHPNDREPRTVRLADGSLGYVEPIVVQPPCLVCHGEKVAPAVASKLAELYPDDQATGYREGDFRGVFWAVSR